MSNVGKVAAKRFFTLLHAYFSWILPYSKDPTKEPINIKFRKLKYFINKLNKDLNADLHVKGLDNVLKIPSETKCAFLPNHLSAYDPMIIACVLPEAVTFLSKIENKKIPLVGRIIAAMEGCFVDRQNFQKAVASMLYIQKDLTEKNKNWVIFPEGTRNKDPMAPLLEYHKGSFKAIMTAGAPIIPVALYGTQNVLKSKYNLKKFPVYLTFLDPITPEMYSSMTPEQVLELTKSRVQEEVNAQRESYYKEIEGLFKTKRALKEYLESKKLAL